ncbi:hypothetical protein DFQ26_003430 [Actinomortierella ambigua]|nr:hypothetical protein DFQ26_003430 [Actinomortierella ambigua]
MGSTTSDLLGFHVPQKQNQYKPYHGPAPCGNPDPLYEYLASPTIVPGLEIIGHDYYGNYVQVLPICPDTSCSMNQDPIYLNLLQAIYAHTIPFLDLPPCSEEESRILLSGLSPSAIHPQSVQPPFLHLLPPKLPARGGANDPTRGWSGYYQTTLGGQTTALLNENDGVGNMQQATTLTSLAALLGPSSSSSASSVSASAATGTATVATAAAASSSPVTGPGLNRRASLPAFPPSPSQMGNNTAAAALLPPTNGRRSSTGSFPPPPSTLNNNNSANPNTNPNNPARKKKNMPRTHPYKSTSTHRDDNSMVMDTIMALSSSKSCGASVTGGLASLLGESRDVPDPKRKVVEKMVHMDETEYANHYLKHQRAMRKSASTTAVSLVQTMATAAHPMMTAKPSSLSSSLASSSSRPSSSGLQKQHGQEKSNHQQHQQHQDFSANTAIASSQHANMAAMDASDFIRAMTRSQYLHPSATNPASTTTGMPTPPILSATPQSDPGWTSTAELAELEKMMMSMDSASMAAFQAAASVISWPKWVDFKQLEQDMCESHTDSSNHATDRSSSIDHNSGTDNNNHHQEAPKLLLSSSTDLDMLDDPLVAEDTVAMTSLSLSDKTSTPPTPASSSSVPSSSSSQHHETRRPKQEPHPTPDDMDCDPFVHIQTNSSTSGAHELPPLPTQVCDPQPPQSPSRSLIAPPSAPAAPSAPAPAPAPQALQAPQQQQQQHQQQQQQQQQRAVDSMEGLAQPYNSTILTVLPFAPEHSRPIFPTRGARRTGWYRSKAVASRGLSAITGVDYTTTCWYNVEQLEQIIKESIAASPITEINPLDSRTLEALTDPRASSSTAADNKSKPV